MKSKAFRLNEMEKEGERMRIKQLKEDIMGKRRPTYQ
jgi:hypothetical protein